MTRPPGAPIWINAKGVKVVRAPLPGDGPQSINAVIAGALNQSVTETPDQVVAALKAHGGAF